MREVRALVLHKDGFIWSEYSLLNPKEFENELKDYCEGVGYKNVDIEELNNYLIDRHRSFKLIEREIPVNKILENEIKVSELVDDVENMYDMKVMQCIYIITDDGLVIPDSTYHFYF